MFALPIEALCWGVFVFAFVLTEIVASNLVNLLRVFGIVLIATVGVANMRRLASYSGEMEGSENEWGFGQIMPMLLLILPVMSIVQSFEGNTLLYFQFDATTDRLRQTQRWRTRRRKQAARNPRLRVAELAVPS